jgi:DNA-binding CsgD family transcriptional regulator
MGTVLEDADLPPEERALAMIGTVFISDEFFAEAMASQTPYVVRRMVKESLAGKNTLLTQEDLATKNAGKGVVMYVVYLAWMPDGHGPVRAETLRSLLVNAYADNFQGNNIRWVVGETAGTYIQNVALRTGCEIINDYPNWDAPKDVIEQDLKPCLVGANRDVGMTMENYWFHRMFTYMTPRFGFTDSQRQVLLHARHGLTDVEIAADLRVSADAVKKRWVGIYERVETVLPGLLPESPPGGRGAEKRRALLMHLRDRPEELRPFSRR